MVSSSSRITASRRVDPHEGELQGWQAEPIGQGAADEFAGEGVLALRVAEGLEVALAGVGDDDDGVHARGEDSLDAMHGGGVPGGPGHGV